MKLITSVKIEQVDHTQVINTAATKVGRAANKAFLFVIHKKIQGWHNLMALCSWGLSRVGEKHGPIFDEVKGSAIAVYKHGCKKQSALVQRLIKVQITDRIDAHWELHNQALKWFMDQTTAILNDEPIQFPSFGKAAKTEEAQSNDDITENTAEGESEVQAPDIIEESTPMAEVDEPVSEVDETPVVVLDPPVDPDPLGDDEMSIPEDPTPVPANAGAKRRSAKNKVESSLSSMMRKEAAKSK